MFNELFKELSEISIEDERSAVTVNVPDDFYQTLLSQLLERDYLNNSNDMRFVDMYDKAVYGKLAHDRLKINWLQITRLPIHPNENENYDLLSRWQGTLSSLHAWGYRLYFLLLRHEGKTKLFLGVASSDREITPDKAIQQLKQAAFGSMPGMELKVLEKQDTYDSISEPLGRMSNIGAVTGIPSFQEKEKKGLLQTLDQLAFGIRDGSGNEEDYAMLVIADPIDDEEITDIISRHRRLSSQIHTAVKTTLNENKSSGESYDPMAKEKAIGKLKGVGLGVGISVLGSVIGAIAGSTMGAPGVGASVGSKAARLIGYTLSAGGPHMGALIGGQVADSLVADASHNITKGSSAGLSKEYLDKFAEYAETATEHHIKRLNDGRNFGFWNAGVYVLGTSTVNVKTVTGILRAIYSGEETYYEPIRLHLFNDQSNALDIVRNHFDLLPMLDAKFVTPQDGFSYAQDQWHLFGKYYQYLSTPVTTKELSLATSLPRRDVPGLRFVKTAVRFANNPAEVVDKKSKISLGKIVDTGIIQGTTYDIDINSLVRHSLVAGITGSGKSTTCKRILKKALDCDVPLMVIEPAKDDYVRWAIKMNESHPEWEPEKKFKIYMPGAETFEGYPIEQLRINLFEPAHTKGALVDLLQHSEMAATMLNACLPGEEIVPILIEETVYKMIEEWAKCSGRQFDDGFIEPLENYPEMYDLAGKATEIMAKKDYETKVRDNFKEVLLTRFKSLSRGTRGKILDVPHSTDFEKLFTGNVIINISRLAGTKDKALVMSLLMQALYEYRISRYTNDAAYRKEAQHNQLKHLALIEEAHNVLLKPNDNQSSGSPQRAAADLFGNMLSEVRGYGQGFVIVDQVPTRLIDDVIKNTNYKIVHRITAPDDQAVMASCMALREDQKYIIPALEKGNAIICGDEDDAAAWVKIPLPGSAEEKALDEVERKGN